MIVWDTLEVDISVSVFYDHFFMILGQFIKQALEGRKPIF